ncbi:hypothetical protein ACTFIY_006882 [Dictyostelium cf. discoideum]
MKYLWLSFLTFSIFLKYSYCQEIYTFDWSSPRVNINGHSHFKVDYYPGTTNANYKGDFFPDVESNPKVKKYYFTADCTIGPNTDFSIPGFITPALNRTENPLSQITNYNSVLIVPYGITVTISGDIQPILTLLVKGKVVLKSTVKTNYWAGKTIIFPTGVFESAPTSLDFNHTITFFSPTYWSVPEWDPLQTSTFISLGGNVTLIGLNSDSMWTGRNSSYTSYGGTFLNTPFPFTTAKQPVFKMGGSRDSYGNIGYVMNNYYTSFSPSTGQNFLEDTTFAGAGYILMRPFTKNLFITGVSNSSMVFTLNSTVNIQNSVIFDVGHTSPELLDDNIISSAYSVTYKGKNIPDRYPITLLHNKVAVNINNNMFMPRNDYSRSALSTVPRAYIGAKRSFGDITGNAFALQNSSSGIALLYGTEQFNIKLNSFISLYTDTSSVSTYRSYPDIDYLNGGIVTTSPYSNYEKNAFEGNFKGGAIQIIPIQGRTSIAGLSTDILFGSYEGLSQDNTADYKVNSIWNNVVYKENFFAGEAEFRVRYPLTAQPPLKINLSNGWFIGQKVSSYLPPNQANIELSYTTPYIASTLSINDKSGNPTNASTHNGKYNAISIVDSTSIASYAFFFDSFTCDYISIKDSVFSHFYSSPNFLKKFTNQLYLSNVNGTKLARSYFIQNFFPFFNLSPTNKILSGNQMLLEFIPNFDYPYSNGQSVSYSVNDAIQGTDTFSTSNLVVNSSMVNKTINFPLANGPYSVFISAKQFLGGTSFSDCGPYFAHTYLIDSNVPNFYLGIDLSDITESTSRALSIFDKQWTKCGWVSGICSTTGSKTRVSPTPSTVTESDGIIRSAVDEVTMLTSYVMNDVTLGIKSSVSITLTANKLYKFFIYSYNPTFTGTIVDPLPLITIKVNGKYQEPYSRFTPQYQKYQKFGPFYFNSNSTSFVLQIEWASNNLKYPIPISGIEIYSNIATPYGIPGASTTTTTGGAIETSGNSTSTTGGTIDPSSTTTGSNYNQTTTTTSSVNEEQSSGASITIISKTLVFFVLSIYFLNY